ncbi:hypothetical protein VN0142_11800 [Helicobacter pylori]
MTNLYSKLDNTAFYDWNKNAQKQPFFLPYLFNFMVNFLKIVIIPTLLFGKFNRKEFKTCLTYG